MTWHAVAPRYKTLRIASRQTRPTEPFVWQFRGMCMLNTEVERLYPDDLYPTYNILIKVRDPYTRRSMAAHGTYAGFGWSRIQWEN